MPKGQGAHLAGVSQLRQQTARVLLAHDEGKVLRDAVVEGQVQGPDEPRHPADRVLQALYRMCTLNPKP